MPTTRDQSGRLCLGGVSLESVARQTGTPTYVYDLDGIAGAARSLRASFGEARHLVAYAVKANSAGPVIRALHAEGCGADVVSGAELALALSSGIPPDAIVYSGVAKTDAEIDLAIGSGARGVAALQIESVEEIARAEARAAAQGRSLRVSLRMNPAASRDALETHAHIATGHDEAKFGVPLADVGVALDALRASPHLELAGFTTHVGSQLTRIDAYVSSARALFELVQAVRAEHGRWLTFVDTGGGFGIDYGEGCEAVPGDFVRAVLAEQRAASLSDLALYMEPGRSLVAAHGVLLARVVLAKRTPPDPLRARRRWLMIDAGMNDLVRPALYQARHRIVALEGRPASREVTWQVVGPVCESSDDFGFHTLAEPPPLDVALLDAGAYGYTMASQYNGRPLPAEVFLAGGRVASTKARGSTEAWIRGRS